MPDFFNPRNSNRFQFQQPQPSRSVLPSRPIQGGTPNIPQQNSSAGPSAMSQVGDFLNSPLGQSIIGGTGAYLENRTNNQQLEQDRSQRATQFAANTLRGLAQDDQIRAAGVVNARPLGESQDYIARNKLMQEIMPELRNFSVTPSDPAIAAAMPQISGGFRIPEGGLSQQMIDQAYGDEAIASALQQREMDIGRLDPRSATQDFSSQFDPVLADALAKNITSFKDQELDRQTQDRDAIMRALEADIAAENQRGPAPEGYEYDKETGELKKKGGGFWGTLGKVASIAAPIVAAPFTGGATLALIGAGAGAAGGALSGGGLKGALLGAGMGAIPGLGGAGNTASSLGQGLKQIATNPMTYSQVAANTLPGKAGQIAGLSNAILGTTGLGQPKAQTPPFVALKQPIRKGL